MTRDAEPRPAPVRDGTPHVWRRRVAIATLTVLALLTLAALLVATTNVAVTQSANGLAYDDAGSVPTRPVAIVFGAGVIDGQPTPALADRVDGAVALYRQGRVSHLLMTGDNSSVAYDEVGVMRDRALAAGVPSSAITRDHAGFSTYDSCYRARDIFGVRAAVLVTQDYHLSRALYTCRQLGIDAVGLSIPDWQHHPERVGWGSYPSDLQASYMTREWFARTKAVVAAKITHPSPTFLGPYEGLRET
jgi:vancomycin permeability regulator SanA